jgi:membrane-associated phospholipid phosphatase
MRWSALLFVLVLTSPGHAGIDHRVEVENDGFWQNRNQNVVRYGSVLATLGLALWQGGGTRLGTSAWQSVDSLALASVAAGAGKIVFGRLRPDQTDDPGRWREGGRSFPSGEVSQVAAIVTPYVLEYGKDNPWAYALELLPAYEAVARVKTGAHWQTDVLAGFALGTLTGYLAHRRASPFILQLMPGSISVGYRKSF